MNCRHLEPIQVVSGADQEDKLLTSITNDTDADRWPMGHILRTQVHRLLRESFVLFFFLTTLGGKKSVTTSL